MCQPLFALAFCAVFDPTSATAAAPAPAVAAVAGPETAAVVLPVANPAHEGAVSPNALDRAPAHDGPETIRAQAAIQVVTNSQAASGEASARREVADTEAKGGSDSASAGSEATDTEPK